MVVAIIAILAAMLLPALSRASATAKKAQCINNLHEMGVALMLYADENNGMAARANSPHWWQVLAPELGSTTNFTKVKIFTCPSYPNPETRYPNKIQLVCFVVNGWTFSSALDPVGSELIGTAKITLIRRPADIIYLADREDGTDFGPITLTDPNTYADRYDIWLPNHLPYNSAGQPNPRSGADFNDRRIALARHGKGAVCLYFDGHAGYRPSKTININDFNDKR